MNQAHADMDEMGEWAQSHPITRRAYIPQGCTQQGRHEATIKEAASACTEIGMDDQSDSADGVFLVYMLCIVAVIGAAVLAVAV